MQVYFELLKQISHPNAHGSHSDMVAFKYVAIGQESTQVLL